jgi:zinc transport system substrate-binding protein
MKKVLIGLMALCSSLLYAEVNAVVSILPQKTFVKAIGGDKVHVALMVKPGNSPHSYEPKPSQMKDIAKADIYFTVGVEFEEAWLPKFADQNKKMKIVSIAKGIEKIEMVAHHHHDDEGDDHHGHKEHGKHAHHDKDKEHHDHHDEDKHESHKHHEHHEDHADKDHKEGYDHGDPHIWTSPSNVKIIAKNIYTYLTRVDKQNSAYYKTNYEKFLTHVDATDKMIKKTLIDLPTGSKFMVFHPAWGYFAKDYGLQQVAIEAGGKNPSPKHIAHIIEEAKEDKVKAIFTAPEFSDTIAKQIADELGIPVKKVSPLNPKWSDNLIQFAKAIANK